MEPPNPKISDNNSRIAAETAGMPVNSKTPSRNVDKRGQHDYLKRELPWLQQMS